MGRLRSLSAKVRPMSHGLRTLETNHDDSRQHQDWRKWYDLARWKRLRWDTLVRDKFTCRLCGEVEADTSKLVGDHRVAHRGDPALFWDPDNIQCLCKPCHDGTKQSEERRGYTMRPEWVRPSAIPVTIVSGPPASGKSYHVEQSAALDDIVIDLDQIVAEVSGKAFTHAWDRDQWLAPAVRRRNTMLGQLSKTKRGRCWFIVSAPTSEERAWWADKLKAVSVIVFETPEYVCLERAAGSQTRDQVYTGRAIERWWQRYDRGSASVEEWRS